LQAAEVEIARVVEGVVGGVLVVIVVSIVAVRYLRRLGEQRRRKHEDPGTPALARFVDTETTDPRSFGGGAWSARVRRRRDTVTYGYLAVAEEYASADSGGRWCTLSVTLPGRVPFLVIDNRAAAGRTDVPMDAAHRVTLDDPPFDATYSVGVADPEQAARVLTPDARSVLLRAPVQRLMLHETQLLLRTFDGSSLDDELIVWLDSIAARFLSSTPSFVAAGRAPATAAGGGVASDVPLPEGFYGPDAD
jgi:hypothetical protein